MIAALACVLSLLIGGPIDPPASAIAPTGKTIGEIEPRIAVQSLPAGATAMHVISQSGSYYLTGNISGATGKNGIQVLADNVTIDLCGFAVVGVTGGGDGFTGPGGSTYLKNTAVINGTVRGWPGSGINIPADNARFEKLRLSNNSLSGINTGTALGTSIADCQFIDNGGTGSGGGNLFTGSGCIVERCAFVSSLLTGSALGVSTADGSVVRDCVFNSVRGTCIAAGGQCVVERNMIVAGKAEGINVGAKSVVSNNTVSGTTANGITLNGQQCVARGNTLTNCAPGSTSFGGLVSSLNHHTIDGNSATFCGQGIRITGLGSIVIRNTARQNLNNFTIGSSNSVGPLVTVSLSGDFAAVANAGSPWANFVH